MNLKKQNQNKNQVRRVWPIFECASDTRHATRSHFNGNISMQTKQTLGGGCSSENNRKTLGKRDLNDFSRNVAIPLSLTLPPPTKLPSFTINHGQHLYDKSIIILCEIPYEKPRTQSKTLKV